MASPAQRPCCDVSRELTDAMARKNWTEVKKILSESSRHVADSVVTQLINEDQWSAVRQVIRSVGDEERTWNIEGNVMKNNILISVAKNDWTCLKESPSERFPDSTFQWIIRQACTRATESQVIQLVLFRCADDRLDSVLTILVEQRLWTAVGRALARSVSDSTKQWAVREACEHCTKAHFGTNSQWSLLSDYSIENGSLVEQCLVYDMLPHCADNELDSVLTTLVERRLWHAVLYVIKRGVSDSSKRWVVLEVCACCDSVSQEQISKMVPFCADDQADCVLTTLVEWRQWEAVREVLKKGVSDSNKQWAVREACKHSRDDELLTLILNILPDCADDQLDSMLTTLVERCQWWAVGVVLKKGVSDSNKQWAVREACTHCKYDFRTGYSRWRLHSQSDQEYDSPVEQCLVDDILPHCADDQLDSVLTTLVERRLWHAVLYVLKRGVSDSSKRWVVLEVCSCCESVVELRLISKLLLFCADHTVDGVLTILVERRKWWAVGEMLRESVSDVNERKTMREANDGSYWVSSDEKYNLPAKQYVGELLQQGVSETKRRWALGEARKTAKSDDFIRYVLPRCSFSNLDYLMSDLVNQGELEVVDAMMRTFSKHMEIESFVLPRWYLDVLPSFVEHHLWVYVKVILHSVVMNSLCHWVKRGGEIKEDDSVFWAMVNTCRVNVKDAAQFFKIVKEDNTSHVHKIQKRLGLTEDLCDLLYTSLVHQVCVLLCSDGELPKMVTGSIKSHINLVYNTFLVLLETSVDGIMNQLNDSELKTSGTLAELNELCSSPLQLFLNVLQQINMYYVRRRGDADDKSFLILLSILPLVPELQSVALRIMLRHKRWDVISHADLSGVWEQDRRHLLQAAVKQRQWSVVKRWADHTLYDDQRVWALNEALKEKQWDVALLLADYGLTDIDLMRVHYRLAKYADWKVILHMFERGADVAEVKERLRRMKDNKRIPENVICCIHDRCSKVANLEKEIQMAKLDTLETACRSCNWIFVLFTLFRNPIKDSVHRAMKVAIQKKAWHVVIRLVRIGIHAKQRHSLFSRMMKRRQWGVCRVLLEQRMSVKKCKKVLPQLMDLNQWALVARVMEHDVGDDVRQQVKQRAWERREGSVVWLCIKSLPTPLSVEERKAMFQRAFSCEMWQVIKPLVEEKDETGIRHRDIALLEAIDIHQWDLVDHCQRHHADINMKDDDGHIPLQRAAMKKDWEAVEELVVRDGDPNLLDSEGYAVLHRAIEARQWSIVKLLIEYQADIHKVEAIGTEVSGISECMITFAQDFNAQKKGDTPLSMLIDARRVDIIDHSLVWCPGQSKGVNNTLETSLHVACLSGCYDSMYNLVARGVNPLAVTKTGQSALVYAVLNEDCPQRMVAECIRLGFSTHQLKLTDIEDDLDPLILIYLFYDMCFPNHRFTSPLLCAFLRGLPVVAQMLYESGACNQTELFRLYTELSKLADPNTERVRKLKRRRGWDVVAYQNFVYCIENIALPYLTEMATTPRSLVSTCRLVISHCLTLSKTRHRDVDQLRLTEMMKNFLLFSDLTDPYFGKDTTARMHELEVRNTGSRGLFWTWELPKLAFQQRSRSINGLDNFHPQSLKCDIHWDTEW